MSIFDLLDCGPLEPTTYRSMVLEYGLTRNGKQHCRCRSWGGVADSIEGAQGSLREHLPKLVFVDPPSGLDLDQLGDRAYKHRWDGAFIYRTDTDQIVSVGWLTPPFLETYLNLLTGRGRHQVRACADPWKPRYLGSKTQAQR